MSKGQISCSKFMQAYADKQSHAPHTKPLRGAVCHVTAVALAICRCTQQLVSLQNPCSFAAGPLLLAAQTTGEGGVWVWVFANMCSDMQASNKQETMSTAEGVSLGRDTMH